MRAPVIAPDGRMPGSSVLDRFHDWQDAMDDGTCTRECGAARNDVCTCRCRGLHHNAARDWWSTPEYLATADLWCAPCQRAHGQGEPCDPDAPGSLAKHMRWLESSGQQPGCTCDWRYDQRRVWWFRKNTAPNCPAH